MIRDREPTADFHQISSERFCLFEESNPQTLYRTVIRQIDLSSLGQEAKRELDLLIDRFGRQQAEFLQLFHQAVNRPYCIGNGYFELRNQFVLRQKRADALADALKKPHSSIFAHGLQARQWKMALQAASNTAERHWRAIQEKAQRRFRNRGIWMRLNATEQHYVNSTLCALSKKFFDVMDGKIPNPTEKMLKLGPIRRPRQLCNLIVEVVREVTGRMPVHGVSRSVWFDAQCWAEKCEADGTQRLSLMALTPKKRIEVRLLGKGKLSGTLVLVKTDTGYAVHVLQKVKSPQKKATDGKADKGGEVLQVRAFDMGFTEVFTDDEGKQYGKGLGKILSAYAKLEETKQSERNRLWALSKTTESALKRRHLLKFNLGSRKIDEKRRRFRAHIESCVNAAINRMLEDNKTDGFIVESLGECFRMEGISKKVRNRLSHWVRGLIDERLKFKAAVKGVRIAKVPAAYSSQRCPVCGYVDRDNRKGDRFKCLHCGHEAQSDANGAVNLLERIHDPFIRRFTPKDAIRRHLVNQYVARCRTKAGIQGTSQLPKS